MATKTTTRTVVKEDEAKEPELLEAWLLSLNERQDVKHVYVYRRVGGTGSWARLSKVVIDPPYDTDPNTIFAEYGDGTYRFNAVNAEGRWTAGRVESVEGVGVKVPGMGGATAGGNVTDHLRELLELTKLQLVQTSLEAQMDRARGRTGGGSPEETWTPEERRLIHQQTMDMELERTKQYLALFRGMNPQPEKSSLHELAELVKPWIPQIVGSLRGQPAEPFDKVIEGVKKLIEVRDVIGVGASTPDMPWWAWAMVAVMSPEVRAQFVQPLMAKLHGAITPAPPQSALPPATPAPPAPRQPIAAPSPAPPGEFHGETPPPETTVLDRARQEFHAYVWPLLRNAAATSNDNFELWANLIDDRMPDFLDRWSSLGIEEALTLLPALTGETPDVLAPMAPWFRTFYAYLKEEYLVPETRPSPPPPTPS